MLFTSVSLLAAIFCYICKTELLPQTSDLAGAPLHNVNARLQSTCSWEVIICMVLGGYHSAVVGATGAAGSELLRVLERRNFPVTSLRPIGSARSAGKSTQFRGESIPIEKLDGRCFDKIDIAFFSAGGDVSREDGPMSCQSAAI